MSESSLISITVLFLFAVRAFVQHQQIPHKPDQVLTGWRRDLTLLASSEVPKVLVRRARGALEPPTLTVTKTKPLRYISQGSRVHSPALGELGLSTGRSRRTCAEG